MDAPLITLDDAANTTDVYAFISERTVGEQTVQYLTTALAVSPFEEPGIGPNNFRFDDNVLYEIHVALGEDIDDGKPTLSYQFEFDTTFKVTSSIVQAYLGPLDGEIDESGFDVNQNLRQTYSVTRVDHRRGRRSLTSLGSGRVPPNNQGLVTSAYNADGGEGRALGGVTSEDALDRHTSRAIFDLDDGHRVFAGQRDDGFYADIQSIFDLDFTFSGDNKPFDSQGGYNVHTIVLSIPLDALGEASTAGVYATTSRQRLTILSKRPEKKGDRIRGQWIQVGRQGNPLFCEALVALEDKDLYNRTSPDRDHALFKKYALQPILATILGLSDQDRQDIVSIFIPDLIRVDLGTGPARLANAGEEGFSRLSIFGGDTLTNASGETVPGGFPNGRRFGDDVVDIALFALGVPVEATLDNVTENDVTFNAVFPYAATPQNGRNHPHH